MRVPEKYFCDKCSKEISHGTWTIDGRFRDFYGGWGNAHGKLKFIKKYKNFGDYLKIFYGTGIGELCKKIEEKYQYKNHDLCIDCYIDFIDHIQTWLKNE